MLDMYPEHFFPPTVLCTAGLLCHGCGSRCATYMRHLHAGLTVNLRGCIAREEAASGVVDHDAVNELAWRAASHLEAQHLGGCTAAHAITCVANNGHISEPAHCIKQHQGSRQQVARQDGQQPDAHSPGLLCRYQ